MTRSGSSSCTSTGLLRGSFRPREAVVQLRAYLRLRERLIEYAAAHIQHMQKALMQMNVQLHHAVTDITGVTGMRIIRAIVAGERSPEVLAAHRDVRCAASDATLRAALTGHYRPEHVFALRQALELYDFHQDKIAECDTQIETALRALAADAHGTRRRPSRRSGTRRAAMSRPSMSGPCCTDSWAPTSVRSMASVRTRCCDWSPSAATT